MVNTMKIKSQRLIMSFLIFFICKISSFQHLPQNNITAICTSFRISYRIKIRRILTQANKCGRLCQCKIFRILVKINISSGLDAYGIMKKVEIIKVHCYYFFFCIKTLKFHSNNPFYWLLQQTFKCAFSCS